MNPKISIIWDLLNMGYRQVSAVGCSHSRKKIFLDLCNKNRLSNMLYLFYKDTMRHCLGLITNTSHSVAVSEVPCPLVLLFLSHLHFRSYDICVMWWLNKCNECKQNEDPFIKKHCSIAPY